jgi:hypothetical protein
MRSGASAVPVPRPRLRCAWRTRLGPGIAAAEERAPGLYQVGVSNMRPRRGVPHRSRAPIQPLLARLYEQMGIYRGSFGLWGEKWASWCTNHSPKPISSPLVPKRNAPPDAAAPWNAWAPARMGTSTHGHQHAQVPARTRRPGHDRHVRITGASAASTRPAANGTWLSLRATVGVRPAPRSDYSGRTSRPAASRLTVMTAVTASTGSAP